MYLYIIIVFIITMGNCIANRTICIKKTIKNESISTISEYSEKPKRKEKRISRKSWITILDYLYFKELKEIGKVNRKLNSLTKSSEILLKFFKKKFNNILNDSTKIIQKNSFYVISEYKN